MKVSTEGQFRPTILPDTRPGAKRAGDRLRGSGEAPDSKPSDIGVTPGRATEGSDKHMLVHTFACGDSVCDRSLGDIELHAPITVATAFGSI